MKMEWYKRDGSKADSLTDRIRSYNQPELTNVEGDHVYILFFDGEIGLTKCGSLFGNRRLATTIMPFEYYKEEYIKVNEEAWPESYAGYKCIFCTGEEAEMLRKDQLC
jgi:hypothetical protein